MQHKKSRQAIDAPGVAAPDGGHLDNLPGNEFHPIILMENPGSGHPVILVNSKQASSNLESHAVLLGVKIGPAPQR